MTGNCSTNSHRCCARRVDRAAAVGARRNDTNVPPTESQQIVDALPSSAAARAAFDDDGHEIDKRENRAVLIAASANGSPARSRPRAALPPF